MCKIRQNIFIALQQRNIGSNGFSSRNSKSFECHSNVLKGESQTNPSIGTMLARPVEITGGLCITRAMIATREAKKATLRISLNKKSHIVLIVSQWPHCIIN
jgi:hypothetical protein